MTSARVECRSCHAHIRARFGGGQDREVMLTCLVCGMFDLYTSADLLPVARTLVPTALANPTVLDLRDPATGYDLAALLVAGRTQRSQR